MNPVVEKHFISLKFGEPQTFGNMTVVPLFSSHLGGPIYLTLRQALDMGALIVTEVDEGGSVPHLKVENKAEMPVLILDGEELVGGKQNRIVNTTVLLKEKQATVIPVSCTEAGRWHYRSRKFSDSDTALASTIRQFHRKAVTHHLRLSGEHRSDQSLVWDLVDDLASRAGVRSPTSAMRDVFETHRHSIDDYVENLPVLAGQQGLVVFVGNRLIGSDFVSQPSAYGLLHPKLIRSYAMDAIFSDKPEPQPESYYQDEAGKFFDSVRFAMEEQHPSVGYGIDFRYESPELVGSALVHEDWVVHSTFFRTDNRRNQDHREPMASARYRRSQRLRPL